jgi:aldehyde dehydrogenase (NAD+)
MSTPNEEPVFDAGQIVSDLRRCARSGRTRSFEWRLSQLEAVRKLVRENEDDIYSALVSDLRKSQYETYISEVFLQLFECLMLDL